MALWFCGAPPPVCWGGASLVHLLARDGESVFLLTVEPIGGLSQGALSELGAFASARRTSIAETLAACARGVEPAFVRGEAERAVPISPTLDGAAGRVVVTPGGCALAVVWSLDRHDAFTWIMGQELFTGVVPSGTPLRLDVVPNPERLSATPRS